MTIEIQRVKISWNEKKSEENIKNEMNATIKNYAIGCQRFHESGCIEQAK